MNESKIAVRYSKALFLSAKEKGEIKRLREDMLFVLRLAGMEDFRDMIKSPIIGNSKKKDIMSALFKDNVHELSFSFIILALNNNRESYLPAIARVFIDMADRHEGITKVILKTAVSISKSNKDKLIEIIEEGLDTKSDLEEIVDSEIGGGYVLRIEDVNIDASLKTQLARIRKELIEG